MQSAKDNEVKSFERKARKRQNSATGFPKQLPTYIVAFALSENTNTSSKEHLLLNKNGTPTTSSKAIESSKQIVADLEVNDFKDELKMNCGDIMNEVSHSTNILLNYIKLNETNSQPQVILSVRKHTRKLKFDAEVNKRKSIKYKRVVIVKNMHFKNKRVSMKKKLKKYCIKAKKSLNSIGHNQKGLYLDAISKRVSRTRVLRKVLAKENLLEENETNNENSFITSPLYGSSFISGSSQSTLTRDDSLSSRNYDAITINSVIEIKDSTEVLPYKTDVISVAVAEISHTATLCSSIVLPHQEKADYNANLTSTESIISQALTLTSKSSFEVTTSDPSSSNDNVSNRTLIPPNKPSDIASQSNCTLKCEPTDRLQKCDLNDMKDNDNYLPAFYEAIMNMYVYPQATPSTSSIPDLPDTKNVLITEDILKSARNVQKIKNSGDERFVIVENDLQGNIFQKPLNIMKSADYRNNVSLPNAAQIESTMVDLSGTQRKCSEEVRDTCPSNFPELCNKLTITLEIAVKRLEQSLSQKIVDELRKSLHEFNKSTRPIPKLQQDIRESMSKEMRFGVIRKSNETIQAIPTSDAYLQCDLIKNKVIDKIMTAFSEEVAKTCGQSNSYTYTHKLKEPKLIRDYLEVLKAPLPSHYKEQETGKGDSIQISIEDAVEQAMPHFDCKNMFYTIPITFLRENIAVIISVPAFLFVMFVIYSYIMFMVRMVM